MESSLITLLFFSFGHELCAYCLQNPAYRLTWHGLSVPLSITFVQCSCATASRQAIFVRSLNKFERWFLTAKNCGGTQLCRSIQFSLKPHFTYTRCKDRSQHFAHDIWIDISRPCLCARLASDRVMEGHFFPPALIHHCESQSSHNYLMPFTTEQVCCCSYTGWN